MPHCPICQAALDRLRQREGLCYQCSRCGGRALTIPQLRRVTGDRLGVKLLRQLDQSRLRSDHACPFCREPMVRVALADPPLEAEGCRPCNAVWLDQPTFETLPEGTVSTTNALALLATDIYAEMKLKEQKERAEAERQAARKKKRCFGH